MNIVDFFFPKRCLECKKEGKYICSSCLKKVRKGGWNSDSVFSAWRYQGVVRKGVLTLKYKYSFSIADELADYLARVLKRGGMDFKDVTLTPIPLHWYKYNLRGFNQSELIGKLIAKKMKWNFIPDLLVKTKQTEPQAALSKVERRENLNGVFTINKKYKVSNFPSVILFDDVLTTGSTLLEALKVLKKEEVKRIFCLTIAR